MPNWPLVNFEEYRMVLVRFSQIDGPGSERRLPSALVRKAFRDSCCARYGIQENFRVENSRLCVRVIRVIVLVRFVRLAGQLVGSRLYDQTDKTFQIVAMCAKIRSKRIQ